MSFFKQFPTTNLQIADQVKRVVDIFRHVDVNDVLAYDISNYRLENIGDGERPDNLSQRLYGTPDYYWTFFIINENLKNGLDDWPKSTEAMEKEFQREYDNLGVMAFKPFIANNFITATTAEGVDGLPLPIQLGNIRNTLAGLDLSYEDLRMYRNFETAKVVKWDNYRQQLILTDFTNRANFFGDPGGDENFLAKMKAVEIKREPNPTLGALSPTNWTEQVLNGALHFTFNDWPIIGKDLENGQNFDYLKTMTTERTEWMAGLFDWWEQKLIDKHRVEGTVETPKSLLGAKLAENMPRKQAVYETFKLYFSFITDEGYQNGLVRFPGFIPHRRVNDLQEHTFQSARNAPFCYYNSTNFTEDNKVTAYDAFDKFDPQHFKSFYQEEQEHNFTQSQIKVVRPSLISAFANAYKNKLNQGITVVGGSQGITSSDSSSGTGGAIAAPASTGGGSGVNVSSGGTTSSGTSSY